MNELISVLIPAYNIEDYIGRCLDSVINNTYRNLEIVCIDDGSTDRTLDVLNAYSNIDSRIQVFSQENKGIAKTRNELLKHVRGDYIGFIDGDDTVHRQYFEVLLGIAKKTNADMIVCRFARYHDSEPVSKEITDYLETYRLYQGRSVMQLESQLFSVVHTRLYKTNLINNRTFDPSLVVEDTPFNIDLLADQESLSVAVTPNSMYYYYQRPGSLVYNLKEPYIQLARFYYNQAILHSNWGQYVYSVKALKTLFVARYEESVRRNHSTVTEMHSLIKHLISINAKNQYPTLKEKCMFYLFAQSPSIYRLFRIKNDPTLLKWEKEQSA